MTHDPGIGQVGFYQSGPDTIIVGDAGRTFEIELDKLNAPLSATDFTL